MADSGASTTTELAIDRTRLAHERTLMAWVRTAASLISFGFTIYKFFEYLREQGQAEKRPRLFGPRQFAMTLIGIGITALIIATIEHRNAISAMRKRYGNVPYSLATLTAGLVAILGLAAILAVLFRE